MHEAVFTSTRAAAAPGRHCGPAGARRRAIPAACRRRRGVGALEVEAPDGRRFLVGSGLTNALRRDSPPVGSSVTYRYRDLTSSGLPRFATFVRRHEALCTTPATISAIPNFTVSAGA